MSISNFYTQAINADDVSAVKRYRHTAEKHAKNLQKGFLYPVSDWIHGTGAMRKVAEILCGKGGQAMSLFAELLTDNIPFIRRWTAFHILELGMPGPDMTARAIRAIEESSPSGSKEAESNQIWLQRWRASHGSREEIAIGLCRLEKDSVKATPFLSMLDLFRASRYRTIQPPITVDEIERGFFQIPELFDSWILYSNELRFHPGPRLEVHPEDFKVKGVPLGETRYFKRNVRAVAEFVVKELNRLNETDQEIAGVSPQEKPEMYRGEKNRLKKLGKKIVEENSQRAAKRLQEANPATIGSDEWAKNYLQGTLKEKSVRKITDSVISAKEASRDFVINTVKDSNFDEGYPSVPGYFYRCAHCGDLIPSKPTKSLSCGCGNLAFDLDSGKIIAQRALYVALVTLIGKPDQKLAQGLDENPFRKDASDMPNTTTSNNLEILLPKNSQSESPQDLSFLNAFLGILSSAPKEFSIKVAKGTVTSDNILIRDFFAKLIGSKNFKNFLLQLDYGLFPPESSDGIGNLACIRDGVALSFEITGTIKSAEDLAWKIRRAHPGNSTPPVDDPDMIKAFDQYGREIFITKQQWKDNVLYGNLDKALNDPDALYGQIVQALQDGFAADVLQYAEHLHRTDSIPARAATLLGIVYMENNRLDDAERTFKNFLSMHGEDAYVLTNLAKVYSHRKDHALAESTLWHALEIDPNQENGFAWYASIQREHGGDALELEAFRRIAALPKSWRAQIWLARYALQSADIAAAEKFYGDSLSKVERPVPSDMLEQMSGDLGKGGYLAEIIRLVEPHYNPGLHGVFVGNNLIKAHFDLGQLDSARRILNQMFAQKRPDWRETLRFWENEIANKEISMRSEKMPEDHSLTFMLIEGPLWARNDLKFAEFLPVKSDHPKRIAVYGSTVILENAPTTASLQRSDTQGRLSRVIPLVLAEKIHLTTSAVGVTMIPVFNHQGFALFGTPHEPQVLCEYAGKGEKVPEFILFVTLDATTPRWKVLASLIRRADVACLAKTQVEIAAENPGPSVMHLCGLVMAMLGEHAGVTQALKPSWYEVPLGDASSNYLLRLEQQLAVTNSLNFSKGAGLTGEREILDGALLLCVEQPMNLTVRMLFAQTLNLMKKLNPEIAFEYREKTAFLQRDHPISGDVFQRIEEAIAQVFNPTYS